MIDQVTPRAHENALKFDVVIVGAGMIGASLALSLAKSDLSIAVVDSAPEGALLRGIREFSPSDFESVGTFESRVSALTQTSIGLLSELGAWPYIQQDRVQPYQKMHVWDELGTGSITFDAAELHAESLGVIVENQQVVLALHEAIQNCDNIACFLGAPIKSLRQEGSGAVCQHCVSLEDGRLLEARLLVAADGANSFVRQQLGFETREWDYGHQAIVATIAVSGGHEQTAWQRFSEAGPLAFLPLRDASGSARYCSIVWSQKTDRARQLMSLPERSFMAELERASEGYLGKVLAVSERSTFPLRQRHAKQYIKSAAVLVGDAAHTIHPLAGQGVNQGFKDVLSLRGILLESHRKEVSVGHAAGLKRYQRTRQGDNLAMMAMMEGFKQVFGSRDPGLRLLRNLGLSFVDKQSLLKKQLARSAMGIQ